MIGDGKIWVSDADSVRRVGTGELDHDGFEERCDRTGPESRRRGGLVFVGVDPGADISGGAWQLADDGSGGREGSPGDPVVVAAQQQLGAVLPGRARRHGDADRRCGSAAAGAAGEGRSLRGEAGVAVAGPFGGRGVVGG